MIDFVEKFVILSFEKKKIKRLKDKIFKMYVYIENNIIVSNWKKLLDINLFEFLLNLYFEL